MTVFFYCVSSGRSCVSYVLYLEYNTFFNIFWLSKYLLFLLEFRWWPWAFALSQDSSFGRWQLLQSVGWSAFSRLGFKNVEGGSDRNRSKSSFRFGITRRFYNCTLQKVDVSRDILRTSCVPPDKLFRRCRVLFPSGIFAFSWIEAHRSTQCLQSSQGQW